MPPRIPVSMVFRELAPALLAIPLFLTGKYIDDLETLRYTRFRDKSALYGGQLKPGDPPSWP